MFENVKRYIQNIPGQTLKQKYVVFESDDWGSIRMPHKRVLRELEKLGVNPKKDPYLSYDSLADNNDLEALYEALQSVKDKKGNNPIITANTIVGNPDFERIEKDSFQKYYWEVFTDTLKRYQSRSHTFDLWKQGINSKLFKPQFHGREHLNVDQWILDLRNEDKWLHEAFKRKMISISSLKSRMKYSYMEGLDYYSDIERINKIKIINEGLTTFQDIFNFKSLTFIANCYIWDDTVEAILHKNEVQFIQGINYQCVPVLKKDNKHSYKYKRHYLGQKNFYDQKYLIRNVFFEPSLNPNFDWINNSLNRIKIAFMLNKPAIIGSHRVNFIGSIQEHNRMNNLQSLKVLLKEIIKNWPDVEFISSDQLGKKLL